MHDRNSWLLPEGMDELLPEDARYLEDLRGRLLKLFECWGYDLVIPPFIDYLDSLLIGSGHDLELQTFKVTDQLSGEMLGIRADMTPQVARIAVHRLKHERVARLCYVGTILHTRGDPLEKTRSPMQIGAELYGHVGRESDLEVIRLMLEMLALTGLQDIHLDLGHVGIYRALARQAGLTPAQEGQLFEVLQRKACSELACLLDEFKVARASTDMLSALPLLNGDRAVLARAKTCFLPAGAEVRQALEDLIQIADALEAHFPHLPLSFDLAELRGYHYHTGAVFAAFIPAIGREIARGGRYDNIGGIFGKARPATGFSADLKLLSALNKQQYPLPRRELIFAPAVDDPALREKIRDLRARCRAVVQELPTQTGGPGDFGCTALLVREQRQWVVKSLV